MTTVLPRLETPLAHLFSPAEGDDLPGFGGLSCVLGQLPLRAMDVEARIVGLDAVVELRQRFANPTRRPAEATYVFPLPARSAVTSFTATLGGRRILGALRERQVAREIYDEAIATGHRAGIVEEERPEVFSARVGNLAPGEEAIVELVLVHRLIVADGEAAFRFPLVVAPRYVPGTPLEGTSVGDGTALDTDVVPDASRVTPPVLLEGCPDPVALSLAVGLEPAGLHLSDLRCSLHALVEGVPRLAEGAPRRTEGARRSGSPITAPLHVQLVPGERLDRDFVLRMRLGVGDLDTAAVLVPDVPRACDDPGATPTRPANRRRPSDALSPSTSLEGDGTFLVTLVPPAEPSATLEPTDVVVVLDRSGSMQGWKMVAARRAAGRIVDSLGSADRFAVLAFDNVVEHFGAGESFGAGGAFGAGDGVGAGESFSAGDGVGAARGRPETGPELMHPASDAWRARAVEWLANLEARGGTELADALVAALGHVAGSQRRSVVVLVTDGQVADEDRLVELAQRAADNVRIHCVGIDQAVNGGLFERLARVGRGHCELVETERRLDDVLVALHRRIRSPQLSGVTLTGDGLELLGSTLTPPGVLDVFPGVPLEITGRYRGSGSIVLRATGPDGSLLERRLAPLTSKECSLGAIWGRSRIRDLEDAYAAYGDETLAATIVATSLATGVLSRHTAFVAVDEAERLANPSSDLARLVQPVPLPAGWAPMSAAGAAGAAFGKSAPSPAQSPMHAAAAMGRSGARRAQFAAAAPSPAASPQHSPVPQQPLPVAPAPLEAAPGHQLFATSLGAAAFGGPETDALLSDSFGAQPELGHGVPASGARAGAASDEELLLRARQLLETARDGKLAPLSALQTAIFYADALLARVGAGEMGCELDQALRGLVVALVEGDQARITNAAEALIALLEDPTGAATTTGGGTAFWRGRPGASAS